MRDRPIVLMKRSISTPMVPTTSARVPLASRSIVCIWTMRSCAITKPSARNASSSLCAVMWGMPAWSKMTSTGESRQEMESSPPVVGSESLSRAAM